MSAAIEIRGLRKTYGRGLFSRGGAEAVKGFDAEIAAGEVWALAGPNGAGKTTTLHCLLGLLYPDAGTLRVFGADPRNPAARRRMGFQSEIFFSYAFYSALDALRFYGRLSGLAGSDLESRAREKLRLVGLESAADQKVGSFSKGMAQRLGLAQSLLHDPDIVIWDEPSSGLDPEGRRMVVDILGALRKEGKTILLSTHILSDIERVCDHIIIMDRGRTLLAGEIQGLLAGRAGATLEDVFLETVKAHAP